MIRIIGGQRKGKKLKTLKGGKLRPTSEKVREAIFDILGDGIRGAHVLDMFAGTGAMGIEALSRGAATAIFIESHRPMARIIRRNLEEAGGVKDPSVIFDRDYRGALSVLERKPERYDVVFMDPPYRKGLARRALQKLSESTILSRKAVVVVEHAVDEDLADEVGQLRSIDRRRYGDTMVSFFRIGEREEK